MAERRTLNGWQRLWVLAALLYGLLVLGVAALDFPKRESIEYFWASRVISTVEEAIAGNLKIASYQVRLRESPEFRGKSDMQIAEDFSKRAYELKKEGNTSAYELNGAQLVKEHNERRARELEELPARQAKFIGWALAAWVVPLVALYLFGMLVAWVIRGFFPKQPAP